MKFVLSCALSCVALAFAAAAPAKAQYPVYAPQNYDQVVYGHSHHSHHYTPPVSSYYSGYAATTYQYAPPYQYAPSVSYPPVYSAGAVYAQPVVPSAPVYYSNNNYYGVPSGHTHHGWHLGHFLMGHH